MREDEEFRNEVEHVRKVIMDLHFKTIGYKPIKIIHNDSATIVFWSDDTKTVIRGHGDDLYAAFCICLAKKFYRGTSRLNRMFDGAELNVAGSTSDIKDERGAF